MGPENVEDFEAAVRGAQAYEQLLERTMPALFAATADDIVTALGGLVTPVDVAALTGELAEHTAAQFRRSGNQGVVGARDDGLALVAPWGFAVADIAVPVSVWQGRQDAMVPYHHGVWLADHIPGARRHLYDDEGHLSLANQMERILADLKEIAGV
jgi:pimeloyl-ACP methyl ester carboxylesterase